MPSLKKKVIGFLSVRIVLFCRFMIKGRSPEKIYSFGRKLGRFLYRILGKRRERCLANLRLAFPEKTEEERVAIAIGAYENFGAMSADFIAGPDRTKEEQDALTTVHGIEHMDNALKRGKGVLMVTGHFGHWERAASWLAISGYKLSVIVRDADQENLNSIVNNLRRGPGTRVIPRGGAARPVLEALRNNEIVALLPDQNADDIYIPFFGHPAGTVLGPGVFHARTDTAVIPAISRFNKDGTVTLEFFPPLEPEPGESVRGEGMMRAINALREREIRKTPEQWLWFHDRWRNARRKGLIEP